MIAAAAVMTRAVAARPSATATELSLVRKYSSRRRESRNTSESIDRRKSTANTSIGLNDWMAPVHS